ncbi:MAG: hypothetical protein H7Z19_07850, partial [Chitinophagaceae bacterium]|nr:hypothetical protein [Rubrivivax sp.]
MTDAQIRLVQDSFSQVEPIADPAAAMFYGRLFELDPSLSRLFKGEPVAQGRKLMQMIGAAVRGLDDLPRLVPVVQQLGLRHAGYGVQPAHYATVGAALLWTLQQGLGAAFTPATRDAWTAVYGVLAETMQAAAREGAVSVHPPPGRPSAPTLHHPTPRSHPHPQGAEMTALNNPGGRLNAALVLAVAPTALGALLCATGVIGPVLL